MLITETIIQCLIIKLGCVMKNVFIFILFSGVLYYCSMFILSWDDDYSTSPENTLNIKDQLREEMYSWNDKFEFPASLYARDKYCPPVTGKTFYVDPVNGSMTNDGSKERPWRTLQEVFSNNLIQHYKYEKLPYTNGGKKIIVNPKAPVRGGDALILLTGNHGTVTTGKGGFYMEEGQFLTIKAGLDSFPVLSSLELLSSSYFFISDLEFECEGSGSNKPSAIIDFSSHKHFGESANIIINSCILRSKGKSYTWTKKDWKKKTFSGIIIKADNSVVRGCRITNVALGISVTGDKAVVKDNIVKNFCVDGLRGNGSELVFESNYVLNSLNVDDNHDDGFQSFLTEGKKVYKNVIIKGNSFIQDTVSQSKYSGSFQGIGCFDGPFENWEIVGNTVISDTWHGISLYGAMDSIVENNTVLPRHYNAKEGPPWIALLQSKSGTAPVNCSVINNQAMAYRLDEKVLQKNNVTLMGRADVDTLLKRFDARWDKIINPY